MHYYDALVQHHHNTAEAQRRYDQARLRREAEQHQKDHHDEDSTPRTAPFARLVSDLKASLEGLRWNDSTPTILKKAR